MSAQAFVDWAVAQGVQLEATSWVESEGEGLGLTAKTDLLEDAVAIAVPLAATLMVRPEAGDAAFAPLLSRLHQVHGLALTLCLASADEQRGVGPWLALWSEAPVGGWGMTEAEWAELGWCKELTELHKQQNTDAKRAYDEHIVPHFADLGKPGSCPTWERFVWAASMVLSRAMGIDMSGDKRLVLTPYIDLLNHRLGSNARLCFEHADSSGGDRIVVRTRTAVAAGEPLTITYGLKPNAELIDSYGFALAVNPHERATLRIPLGADDPLRAKKLAMLPSGVGRAEDGVLSGTLCWEEAEAGGAGDGDGDGDGGAAPTEPHFAPELQLLLAVVSAGDIGELFAAMGGMGGGGPASWQLVARCCDAQLAQLDARSGGAEAEGAAESAESAMAGAAVEARRALLTHAARRARELEQEAAAGGLEQEDDEEFE